MDVPRWGEPHSVRGIEDTSLLLTILFAAGSGQLNPDEAEVPEKPAEKLKSENSDSLLDEGLLETFPASDPVSIINPSTGIKSRSRGDANEKMKTGDSDGKN